MERVRLLVVEDDALIANDLSTLLGDLGYFVCGISPNAISAHAAIALHRPDLLLLDINLGGGDDGVRIAEVVNATGKIPFVFVTGHTDAATIERVKAVRPAGFIIKPFDEDDLRTQIEIALARYAAQLPPPEVPTANERQDFRIADVLFVRDKGRLAKVPLDDIQYIEASDNYVVLHTAVRKYAMVSSLSALEERLASPNFLRIHRRYLVDLRRVVAIREREAVVGDVVLPVGRTHRDALRKRWGG